jgi:hypothetical protein
MATAAAAAVARARRDIQHHFFSMDAVRPDRAVPCEPSRRIERRQFERMQERGIIREVRPGRFWLDVVAYDKDLSGRYRRVKIMLAISLVLFAIALLIPVLRH